MSFGHMAQHVLTTNDVNSWIKKQGFILNVYNFQLINFDNYFAHRYAITIYYSSATSLC